MNASGDNEQQSGQQVDLNNTNQFGGTNNWNPEFGNNASQFGGPQGLNNGNQFNTNQNTNDFGTTFNLMFSGGSPEFIKYVIFSILEMICCNQIFGAVALVFTLLANADYGKGNIAKYQSNIKGVKLTLIIGVITGLLCGCLSTIGIIFGSN